MNRFSVPDDRRVIWKKGSRVILPSFRNTYALGASNRSLSIESLTISDGGRYTIELVRNNSRRIEVLSTAHIDLNVICKFQTVLLHLSFLFQTDPVYLPYNITVLENEFPVDVCVTLTRTYRNFRSTIPITIPVKGSGLFLFMQSV